MSQITIKIDGFSTALSDWVPAEGLSSLEINDAESAAEITMLASGTVSTRLIPKAPEGTSIPIMSTLLKTGDRTLYNALSKAGEIGTGATVTNGIESTTYNKIVVMTPLMTMGNSGTENKVTIAFCGSGKR